MPREHNERSRDRTNRDKHRRNVVSGMPWQPISEARHMPEGTTADLLLDTGKVVRATWKAVPGTLANCCRSRRKIPTALVAWWLEKPTKRMEKIGLYEPISFRVVQAS